MPDKKRHFPPPEGMIGPRIIHASRLLRQRFNKALNDEGLFSGQQHIIFLLTENEGMTVSEISKRLDIAPATASVSIKRMEKAGFVEKKADKNDARITKLYLTEKGKATPENLRERMDAQEEFLTKNMTASEIILLSGLLDRIAQNLQNEEENDD